MEATIQTTDFAGRKSGKAGREVRNGIKSILLAKEIRKELKEGISLEDAVSKRIPVLDGKSVAEDVRQLQKGVRSMYDSMGQTVDADWARQRLNKALTGLDNQRRVAYLGNVIAAVTAAYPEVALDEEAAHALEKILAAEENTDEDVEFLMEMAQDVLPKFGALLQRSSVSAMMKHLHKVDHGKVESRIQSGEESVTIYAAACYVMQKCGELWEIDGKPGGNMPAFALGVAAAASVESSRLMELYCAGKMTLQTLTEKLRTLYTAAAGCAFEGIIRFLAISAYGVIGVALAVVLIEILELLGAFLFFSPILIIIGVFVIAFGLEYEAFTVKDCEDVILAAWDILKSGWDAVRNLWHKIVASFRSTEGTEEAGGETEYADQAAAESEAEQAEFEDAAEETEESQETDQQREDIF